MKFLTSFAFVVISVLLHAQEKPELLSFNDNTEAYVLRIENKQTAKIYHLTYQMNVTNTSILVTTDINTDLGDKKIPLFSQPYLKWSLKYGYLETEVDNINIKYYARTHNLVVDNGTDVTTFYGEVPALIEIIKK